ncbi:hypothetical protein WR25_07151 [Diploscapter pachys]|uniref:Mitochondrial 2-oxodicarboxylate carrier n=1 Tax=Diploscapter pachys TaxID=2018661 RepID=A0A2A2J1W5_9BILA|nr:hypothetical protein WR25_07151 [Diploscapter pachys]
MNRVKEGACQIAAGGSAGLVEVCLMQPLDVVKTRLQIVGADSGMASCIQNTYKNEGMLGFYKGILPPILAETPKRATKFFTFEQYKIALTHPDIPIPMTFSIAGMLSGCTEGIIVCPFELVKIRQQAERNVKFSEQRSSAAMVREIIRTEGYGINGIYRGLTATLARNGTWNMVYFGLYHTAKDYIPPAKESHAKNLIARIFLGFLAGSLASVANIPFDVAKSRIQGPQPVKGQRKYHSTLQSLGLIYKEEGVAALYRGLLPKVMRLGPGGAVMLIVYENVYGYLKQFI